MGITAKLVSNLNSSSANCVNKNRLRVLTITIALRIFAVPMFIACLATMTVTLAVVIPAHFTYNVCKFVAHPLKGGSDFIVLTIAQIATSILMTVYIPKRSIEFAYKSIVKPHSFYKELNN